MYFFTSMIWVFSDRAGSEYMHHSITSYIPRTISTKHRNPILCHIGFTTPSLKGKWTRVASLELRTYLPSEISEAADGVSKASRLRLRTQNVLIMKCYLASTSRRSFDNHEIIFDRSDFVDCSPLVHDRDLRCSLVFTYSAWIWFDKPASRKINFFGTQRPKYWWVIDVI